MNQEGNGIVRVAEVVGESPSSLEQKTSVANVMEGTSAEDPEAFPLLQD